jgi:hypothetical protein
VETASEIDQNHPGVKELNRTLLEQFSKLQPNTEPLL